jgi:diacylglycerol kinase (ATP)
MKNSFKFAFRGFWSCLKTERNLRFHLGVTFYVIVGGLILRLPLSEWLAVFICAGAVLSAELFNTALEKLCDALHPGRSPAIGLVKDITAGAVLMLAVTSAVVGVLVFFRADQLTRLLAFVRENTLLSAVILLTVPINLYLVFRSYANDKISRHHHRRTSQRR